MWGQQSGFDLSSSTSTCFAPSSYSFSGGGGGSDYERSKKRGGNGGAPFISLSSNVTTTASAVPPAEKEREKSFDGLLAEAISKVSLEERDESLHELHGIIPDKVCAQQIEEDHDLRTKKIQDMDVALSSIDMFSASSKQEAYSIALSQSPEYVDSLKLMFLRSDNYNTANAANRMLNWFKTKLELFGIDKLTKDIALEDLGDEDKTALRRGLVQLLPCRDRAGRAIFFFYGAENKISHSTETVLRVLFYVTMKGLQDTETQIKGAVPIIYTIGQTERTPGRAKRLAFTLMSLPLRYAGFHFVANNIVVQHAGYIAFRLLDKFTLCRSRLHTDKDRIPSIFSSHLMSATAGTHMECIYDLMTYGIPKEALPIGADGSMNLTSHHSMLKSFELIEKEYRRNSNNLAPVMEDDLEMYIDDGDIALPAVASAPVSSSPAGKDSFFSSTSYDNNDNAETKMVLHQHINPMDVLMGRGRRLANSPGNVRLREILQANSDEYEAANEQQKTKIARRIVEEMKQSGTRFMKKTNSSSTTSTKTARGANDLGRGHGGDGIDDGEYYIECDDTVARAKISHGFRNLRKKALGKTADDGTVPSESLTVSSTDSSSNTSTSTNGAIIIVPGPLDVLMGRGRLPSSQGGNLRMHHMLAEYKDEYENASKQEKTKLTAKIVMQMKESGTRFLSSAPGGYIECDVSMAKSKISHGFRHLRSSSKKEKKATNSE